MKHFLVHLPDITELVRVLSVVKDSKITPYSLHFADPQCVYTMHKLGFSPDRIDRGCLLAIDYEGLPEQLSEVDKFIAALVRDNPNVNLLPTETAEREWAEKFMSMRLKRGGPSILGGEVWLPISELSGYWADIQNMAGKYNLDIMSYGHIVTPEYVTVMSMFFTDENRIFHYILDLSLLKKIHDIGNRHRGSPYGVGLWNTPYIGRIFQPSRLNELRKRKKKLDPKGLMNPGKIYRWPRVMNPFCFGAAMRIMSGIARLTGRDRWQ
jgi:glycolate oxidase